ncbi:glycosyl hydrolase family 61-domain-containing protein [Xylariaceae sp. FL0016]|nr:glycosyl hydrolase family 61-domain-containing protein [Xylariaceae sp. FL0016]
MITAAVSIREIKPPMNGIWRITWVLPFSEGKCLSGLFNYTQYHIIDISLLTAFCLSTSRQCLFVSFFFPKSNITMTGLAHTNMQRFLANTLLVTAVTAHQNFHQLWVNGETPGYQVGIRMPPSNNPVTDVTSNDIVCNVDGTSGTGVAVVPVAAGDSIEVQWDSSTHPGPITHFLYGPVDDVASTSGVGAGWFKIDELDYVNGQWANEIMEADNMTYTFSLPSKLQSGEYLLRSEMLALHGSMTVGGAQFYIGCAQLSITGSGGTCSPTISLPGAYSAEDADIYIPDFYNGFDPTTYEAPGGDVATCS